MLRINKRNINLPEFRKTGSADDLNYFSYDLQFNEVLNFENGDSKKI